MNGKSLKDTRKEKIKWHQLQVHAATQMEEVLCNAPWYLDAACVSPPPTAPPPSPHWSCVILLQTYLGVLSVALLFHTLLSQHWQISVPTVTSSAYARYHLPTRCHSFALRVCVLNPMNLRNSSFGISSYGCHCGRRTESNLCKERVWVSKSMLLS